MLSRNYKLQQKQDETNGQATGEAKRFRAQRNREEKNYRTLDEFKEIVDKYFSLILLDIRKSVYLQAH